MRFPLTCLREAKVLTDLILVWRVIGVELASLNEATDEVFYTLGIGCNIYWDWLNLRRFMC